MKNINEIGILACGTRMKRLYDHLTSDGKSIYRSCGLDFEPKWFTIIYALIEEKERSVTDLSNVLGLSHPTIIQSLKELEKKKWVVSRKSETDGRIRLASLSKKAIGKIPELKNVWNQMRRVFEVVNNEGQINFWEGFLEFERAFTKKSFEHRVTEIIGQQKRNKSTLPAKHPGEWFKRKFDFKHLSVTPEGLMERLRCTPLRLRSLTEGLSPAQRKILFQGKWSVQENIGHLNDLEPLWFGRVQDIINVVEIMRPADLTNKKSHEAGHNEVSLENLLSEFTVNRNKLVQLCEENYDKLVSSSSLHPRLMIPMRIIDLLYFVAEHDDHHLATIRYLTFKI